MDYLILVEKRTDTCIDHRNFLFLFNPVVVEFSIGRLAISKVQRWGLYLSLFSYLIEHVLGEKNIMAGIMTRLFKGYARKHMEIRRIASKIL